MAWSPALNSWGSALATEPPPGSIEPENDTPLDLFNGPPSFTPTGGGDSVLQATARPVANFASGPFVVSAQGSSATASQGAPSQTAASGFAPIGAGGLSGGVVLALAGVALVTGLIAVLK